MVMPLSRSIRGLMLLGSLFTHATSAQSAKSAVDPTVFSRTSVQLSKRARVLGNPLEILVGNDLSFQVVNKDASLLGQFFPPDGMSLADAGVLMRAGGVLYAPAFNAHAASKAKFYLGPTSAWRNGFVEYRTGSGSPGDPHTVFARADAPPAGIHVEMTLTYVDGQSFFRKHLTFTNNGFAPVSFDVFVASDPEGPAGDVPVRHAPTSGFGCQRCSDPSYFVLHIGEAAGAGSALSASSLWTQIGAGNLSNNVDYGCMDAAAAVEWPGLDLLPGASVSLDCTTSIGPVADSLSCRNCETIRLRSGTVGGMPGFVGDVVDLVTCITAYSSLPVSSSPFTNQDFSAADHGSPVFVVPAYWIPGLSADLTARWMNAEPGAAAVSALYSIPFDVSTPSIDSASLELSWSVDNFLGDNDPNGPGPNHTGVYLNGQPLAGLALNQDPSGYNFRYERAEVADVTALIRPGENRLYLYQRDFGGISGTIFSATIQIVPKKPQPIHR